MLFFLLLFSWVVLQRLLELWVAKKNERWMKARGAVEYGKAHYPWLVGMHVLFLLVFLLEAALRGFVLAPGWQILLLIFLSVQGLRVWSLRTLGYYWNVKILVRPGDPLVRKGPYRWLKHPNYLVVMMEILLLPLMFQAYVTAVIFTILNACLLFFIRIPSEERALSNSN